MTVSKTVWFIPFYVGMMVSVISFISNGNIYGFTQRHARFRAGL